MLPLFSSGKDDIREDDIIDFGQNVLLGQFKDRILIIENQSAIETNFYLNFDEFQCARLPTPPDYRNGKRFFLFFFLFFIF